MESKRQNLPQNETNNQTCSKVLSSLTFHRQSASHRSDKSFLELCDTLELIGILLTLGVWVHSIRLAFIFLLEHLHDLVVIMLGFSAFLAFLSFHCLVLRHFEIWVLIILIISLLVAMILLRIILRFLIDALIQFLKVGLVQVVTILRDTLLLLLPASFLRYLGDFLA